MARFDALPWQSIVVLTLVVLRCLSTSHSSRKSSLQGYKLRCRLIRTCSQWYHWVHGARTCGVTWSDVIDGESVEGERLSMNDEHGAICRRRRRTSAARRRHWTWTRPTHQLRHRRTRLLHTHTQPTLLETRAVIATCRPTPAAAAAAAHSTTTCDLNLRPFDLFFRTASDFHGLYLVLIAQAFFLSQRGHTDTHVNHAQTRRRSHRRNWSLYRRRE